LQKINKKHLVKREKNFSSVWVNYCPGLKNNIFIADLTVYLKEPKSTAMYKFLYLAAASFFFLSCNNSDSPGATNTDSSKKSVTNALEVPPELIVTAEQVNAMLEHYNSDNGNKDNTLILTVSVGYLKTVMEGLKETDNLEMIFGSYTDADYERRLKVYPDIPKDEVVDRACIIFRNPTNSQNYDITVKLCPPPTGPCDVSFYKDLKDSAVSKNKKFANEPIMIPENLQISAADVNAMLANYLSEGVNKTSSNILTVNVGFLETVVNELDDKVDLQLVFGAYTPADFTRRQPSYPSTGKGDVINSPTIVFRNDETKMNFDITIKLCPPPTGACNVSFYQDLKPQAAKK
jgi:hypothetical protein